VPISRLHCRIIEEIPRFSDVKNNDTKLYWQSARQFPACSAILRRSSGNRKIPLWWKLFALFEQRSYRDPSLPARNQISLPRPQRPHQRPFQHPRSILKLDGRKVITRDCRMKGTWRPDQTSQNLWISHIRNVTRYHEAWCWSLRVSLAAIEGKLSNRERHFRGADCLIWWCESSRSAACRSHRAWGIALFGRGSFVNVVNGDSALARSRERSRT